jgi:ribosomal protein S27AE
MATDEQNVEPVNFKASYIRTPNKDVVGGRLQIDGDFLVFEPNSIAKKTSGEENHAIALYKIEDLEKETAGRGVISFLTGGRLGTHLHIRLNDGAVYVFTVSSVSDKIEMLTPYINSATAPEADPSKVDGQNDTTNSHQYCPSCGKGVSEEAGYCPNCGTALMESEGVQESENEDYSELSPRFPILSVFSSLMILRTSFVLLDSPSGMVGFLIFAGFAISIIPRVRLRIYKTMLVRYGIDLKNRIWFIIMILLYSILTFISSLLILGEGGVIGFFSIAFAFIFAIVLVFSSRMISKVL